MCIVLNHHACLLIFSRDTIWQRLCDHKRRKRPEITIRALKQFDKTIQTQGWTQIQIQEIGRETDKGSFCKQTKKKEEINLTLFPHLQPYIKSCDTFQCTFIGTNAHMLTSNPSTHTHTHTHTHTYTLTTHTHTPYMWTLSREESTWFPHPSTGYK